MNLIILIKEWSHLISQSLGWEKTGMNSTRGEEQEVIIMGDWSWLHLRYSSDIIISMKGNWLNNSLDKWIDSWWCLLVEGYWWMSSSNDISITHWSIWLNLRSTVRWLGWPNWSNDRITSMEEEGKIWIQFDVIISQLNHFRIKLNGNLFDLWDFCFIFFIENWM